MVSVSSQTVAMKRSGAKRCVGVVAELGFDFFRFFCCVVHPDFALVFAHEFSGCFNAVACNVGELVFVHKSLYSIFDNAKVVCAVDDKVNV